MRGSRFRFPIFQQKTPWRAGMPLLLALQGVSILGLVALLIIPGSELAASNQTHHPLLLLALGMMILSSGCGWRLSLRASEAQIRELMDSATAAITRMKVFPDATWEILHVSAGCELLSGYTPEELTLDKYLWTSRILPEDWQTNAPGVFADIFAERTGTYEYRLRRRDDTVCWFSQTTRSRWDQGQQAWIVTAVTTDISDRKAIETQLRRSEAALAEAQRIANLGSWEFDLETQQVTWSTEVFRIFGMAPTATAPDYPHFLQLLPPEDRQLVETAVDQALTHGIPYELEHRFTRADGSLGWLFGRGEAIYNAQGKITKLVGTTQDITERKQAELELQQAKEAAEVASQAKSVFLSNISHELRTPLSAILGFTEILAQDTDLTEQQRETLSLVQSSGDHLLNLINDVLDLSKIEAGQITLEESCFDLIQLVRSLQDMFRQSADSKGLQMHLEIAPTVPRWIIADINKLRQILINLLGNAIKFTAQGHVALRVGVEPADADAESLSGQPRLTFAVEDSGIGIAAAEVDAIFAPFIQSTEGRLTAGGTGLGLTISRRFVDMMGGTLAVQSTVGHGSTFVVNLPLCPAPQQAAPADLAPGKVVGLAAGETPRRVLVVDDAPVNLKIVSRLLSPLDFEVREASNGAQALQVLQTWVPDLILMDMNMPDIDGYEATRRIRQSFAELNLPIIALTAAALDQERFKALEAGCNDFLGKPFKSSDLYGALTKHLGVSYQYESNLVSQR